MTAGSFANPIDEGQALDIATQFGRKAEAGSKLRSFAERNHLDIVYKADRNAGKDAYYYVAQSRFGGYIIVSGEDRTAGVLGFVDSGSFDINDIPDNMRYWLGEFARQVDYLDKHPEARAKDVATEGKTSVAPLLGDTKWNQSPFYNKYTPDSRFPIGCVAVSLGQIMRYWQWPDHGEGSHSYVTTTHQFEESADFANTTYNWAAMTDELNASSADEAVDAVATLLHHVAVSVNMDYDNGGSGAYSELMAPAMANHFRYDKGIHLVKRNFFDSHTWMQMVREELDNGRPVVYDGATSSMSGHSFVCDGYNEDGFYHINWGWGGSGNGYFLLNALAYDYVDMATGQSMKDGFNYYQDMLIGFKPDKDGTSVYRPHEMLCEGLGDDFSLVVKKGESVPVTVCEVYNTSNFDLDLEDFGFVVYDNSNNIVATKTLYSGNTYAGQYLDTLRSTLTVPATLAEGSYVAKLQYKVKGEEKYSDVMMTVGTANEISIKVGTDNVEYSTVGKAKLNVLEMQSTPEVLTSDVPSTVKLTVKNEGGKYDGAVSFRLNIVGDELTKHWYTSPKQDITIGAGETAEITFNQTLELAGDDNYEFTLFDREDNVVFHTIIPLIGREKEPDLQLVKEIYFTPRDYQVPINCMILNAEIRNDGGKYDGRMTVRILDEENYFCDGADMDTAKVVIEGGETKTVRMHGTYDPNKDWSMSNIRIATVYDITGKKYLEPQKYNLHEFTYGAKDPDVTWEPDEPQGPTDAIDRINGNADPNLAFSVQGDIITVTAPLGLEYVAVYSMDGRLMLRQYAGNAVDISQMPGGTYVVVAKTGIGMKAEKIVRE